MIGLVYVSIFNLRAVSIRYFGYGYIYLYFCSDFFTPKNRIKFKCALASSPRIIVIAISQYFHENIIDNFIRPTYCRYHGTITPI